MSELHGTEGAGDKRRPGRLVYSEAPVLLYWEITRACDLACRHCWAEAIPQRDPAELSTAEARGVLEKIHGFGNPMPHLAVTGGDPLKRPDLFPLLEYGARLGLHISVAPSVTSALTQQVLQRLKATAVESISLSLDGATAEQHDSFRSIGNSNGIFQHFPRWLPRLRSARAPSAAQQPLWSAPP